MVSCKAQEKSKADAYFSVREGLDFLQQRRRSPFWNSLLVVQFFFDGDEGGDVVQEVV